MAGQPSFHPPGWTHRRHRPRWWRPWCVAHTTSRWTSPGPGPWHRWVRWTCPKRRWWSPRPSCCPRWNYHPRDPSRGRTGHPGRSGCSRLEIWLGRFQVLDNCYKMGRESCLENLGKWGVPIWHMTCSIHQLRECLCSLNATWPQLPTPWHPRWSSRSLVPLRKMLHTRSLEFFKGAKKCR